MDPDEDREYLYIALEGLRAPVPEPWVACQNEEGEIFFQNSETEEISWNHPLDDFYRELFLEIKSRDMKKKNQEEKEKQMRKNAGKLKSLAPINQKNQNIPSIAQISNQKLMEESHDARPFESKTNNKLMNISNISSNHSKKTNSFFNEDNPNNKSIDLSSMNSKSFEKHSITPKEKNAKRSPLKDRKLKIGNAASTIEIDKWYNSCIEKYIMTSEENLENSKIQYLEQQQKLAQSLEEKLLESIENLKNEKNQNLSQIEDLKNDKEKLIKNLEKENKASFERELNEIHRQYEQKKNEFMSYCSETNKNKLANAEKDLKQIATNKKEEIINLKKEKQQMNEINKNKMLEKFDAEKQKIQKEVKFSYETQLEKFKRDSMTSILKRKEENLQTNSKDLQIKSQKNAELAVIIADTQKNSKKEFFARKFEIEKKHLDQNFQEKLEEFSSAQEIELKNNLRKFRSSLLEKELTNLERECTDEKESLSRIHQNKLNILKMEKQQKTSTSHTYKNIDAMIHQMSNFLVF